MPIVDLVLFSESDGAVPILEWFDRLSDVVVVKCRVRIRRLKAMGHELRRPEADYLRDGIYELRVSVRTVNYRMLYFFYGTQMVVVSHGLIKEKRVPPKEIELATKRRHQFETDPVRHTYREKNHGD